MTLSKNISILLVISILFVSSCNNQEVEPKDSIKFNLDSALINESDTLSVVNIFIASPKNWLSTDEQLMEKISSKLGQVIDSNFAYKYKLMKIYFDSTSASLLTIGIISQDKYKNTDSLINDYASLIETKFSGSNIKKGFYRKDNIDITQLLIQEKETITFKLLFINNRKNLVQVDYILDSKNYLDLVKKAESSIASIKLITNK